MGFQGLFLAVNAFCGIYAVGPCGEENIISAIPRFVRKNVELMRMHDERDGHLRIYQKVVTI